MRIGVLIPTRGIVIQSARRPAVDECWAMARHAEAAGYDAVWVGDSIVAKPRLEALTTLAYLAGITTRVRLGTAVLLPALRHPVVLAHQIANVDQISRGRVVMGLGVGWSLPSAEREWAACGADHKRAARPPPGGARRDLADALARRAGHPSQRRRGADRSHARSTAVEPGRAPGPHHGGEPRRDARRAVRPLRPARRRDHHDLCSRRRVPPGARAGRGSAGPTRSREGELRALRLYDRPHGERSAHRR